MTRRSGKGSKSLARECTDQQLDRFSLRTTILERMLPLPGLVQRPAFVEIDQFSRHAPPGRVNVPRAMLCQTPDEVVRAAVVVAAVGAAKDLYITRRHRRSVQHERRGVSRVDRPGLRFLAVLPEGVERREALVRPTPEKLLACAG